MKKYFTILLVLLFGLQYAKSSSYVDTSINVNGLKHKLLLCIPADYASDKDFPLVIGLHYCTSSATVYRDALRKMSDSLHLIIACPDNSASEISDNDISMLQIAIDTVKSMYNVNENEMFLTGMSCNGKVTLKHGLKGTFPFKGIFPWAPWITDADFPILDMNSKIPVTISIGTADPKYPYVIQFYDSLKKHQANVNLIVVNGIGHTLAFSTFADEMIKSLNYINDTNAFQIDEVGDVNISDNETKQIETVVKYQNVDAAKINIFSTNSNITFSNISVSKNTSDGEINVSFSVNSISTVATKGFIIVEAVDTTSSAVEQVTFKVTAAAHVVTSLTGSKNQIKMVYPSPADQFIKVQGIKGSIDYKILDSTGKMILNAQRVDVSKEINVSSLKKGMYFLNVKNENEVETFKFLVK